LRTYAAPKGYSEKIGHYFVQWNRGDAQRRFARHFRLYTGGECAPAAVRDSRRGRMVPREFGMG